MGLTCAHYHVHCSWPTHTYQDAKWHCKVEKGLGSFYSLRDIDIGGCAYGITRMAECSPWWKSPYSLQASVNISRTYVYIPHLLMNLSISFAALLWRARFINWQWKATVNVVYFRKLTAWLHRLADCNSARFVQRHTAGKQSWNIFMRKVLIVLVYGHYHYLMVHNVVCSDLHLIGPVKFSYFILGDLTLFTKIGVLTLYLKQPITLAAGSRQNNLADTLISCHNHQQNYLAPSKCQEEKWAAYRGSHSQTSSVVWWEATLMELGNTGESTHFKLSHSVVIKLLQSWLTCCQVVFYMPRLVHQFKWLLGAKRGGGLWGEES